METKNFYSAGIRAGFKRKEDLKDLGVIFFPQGAQVAGVFTQNRIKAWPVHYDQDLLQKQDQFKAILVNSGNANACNGDQGKQAILDIVQAFSQEFDVEEDQILVSSTGIIGAPFKTQEVISALAPLHQALHTDRLKDFNEAIMTTDTVEKIVSKVIDVDGQKVEMVGVAKGAGMIHPRLGTMLAYIIINTSTSQADLQAILKQAAQDSFNLLTVDGDMSTNDSVFLCSTGEVDVDPTDQNLQDISQAVTAISQDLAKMIAADGEGATKFIDLKVESAATEEDANHIARAIAHSKLVKTAMYGEDANFGRIIAAVGYSPAEHVEADKISISFSSAHGQVQVCQHGQVADFDVEKARHILQALDITIEVQLNIGQASAHLWTCDLTHDYISINADYEG